MGKDILKDLTIGVCAVFIFLAILSIGSFAINTLKSMQHPPPTPTPIAETPIVVTTTTPASLSLIHIL